MSFEDFTKWWQEFKSAISITPQLPLYDPNVFNDNQLGKDNKAEAVVKVLGVEYGGKTTESWFSQHLIVL
jgi:hypothetical protein